MYVQKYIRDLCLTTVWRAPRKEVDSRIVINNKKKKEIKTNTNGYGNNGNSDDNNNDDNNNRRLPGRRGKGGSGIIELVLFNNSLSRKLFA